MFLYPSQLQRTILGRFERFTSHRVLTVGGRYEIECRKKLDKILTRKAARPTAYSTEETSIKVQCCLLTFVYVQAQWLRDSDKNIFR